MNRPASIDASNPAWMPLAYDYPNDRYRMVRVDERVLSDAAFLDQRLGATWEAASWLPAAELAHLASADAPSWLFHTAFCCSTLLARALHSPPSALVLKEPGILLDLAHLSLREPVPCRLLEERIHDTVGLLARPRQADTRVVIKPTNAANRLLPEFLAVMPETRAVLLYGSLENFLMSCVKKLPGAEEPMRWMAGYVLPGTHLEQALGIAGRRLNFIEACVLTWFAQMEIYALALAHDHMDRLRSLDMQVLLHRPHETVAASAAWLDLTQHEERQTWDARVAGVFSRNSKQSDAVYSPEARSKERELIKAHYGELVRAALAWADQAVAPCAVMPSEWKPLAS